MDTHIGFVRLGQNLLIPLLTRASTTLIPKTADSYPSYVIYDSDETQQIVGSGSGTMALRHSGSVSACANSGGLIRITTPTAHGLVTGQVIDTTGIGGVTGANATWPITVVNSTQFTLDGSTFAGAYTSGGFWNVTAFYWATHDIDESEYAAGKTYQILCNYLVASVPLTEVLYFTVV